MLEGPVGASPLAASTISAEPLLSADGAIEDAELRHAHLRGVGGAHAYSELRRGDRNWLVRVAPRPAASGDPREAVAVAVDVTEVARRSDAFARAAKTFARDDNPSAVVASFLGGLCSDLGWQSATLWLVDPETDDLVCTASQSTNAAAAQAGNEPGTLVREVWRSRTPRQRAGAGPSLVGDDEADYAAPVVADGRAVGVIASAGAAVASRNDLRTLEAMGFLLGQYLRLQQAKQQAARADAAIERTRELIEGTSPQAREASHVQEPGPWAAAPADEGADPAATMAARLERLLGAAADQIVRPSVEALERFCALYAAEDGNASEIAERLQAIAGHADQLSAMLPTADASPQLDTIRSATASALRLSESRARLRDGSPLALVVSQHAASREVAARTLEGIGFVALTAADGHEAEALATAHPGLLSLLVGDLIIAPTSASQLACRLSRHQPRMRVVYHAPDHPGTVEIGPHGEEVEIVRSLLTPDGLHAAVAATFAGRRRRRSAPSLAA